MHKEMASIEKDLSETFERFTQSGWRRKQNLGIKPSEVRVLLCLKILASQSDNGVSISDISKSLAVTSPTVTQMIKHLIKSGYVQTFHDFKDKRITLLRLTDRGETLAQQAMEQYKLIFSGLIERLGEEQCHTLIVLLRQVYNYFLDIEPCDK
ncbi:MarR family winged helix-turn-helix transcriptional regulator [Paenibacillus eucommiae]|uniref:DNA-binding MarR family transcriptional regulator n=1 Tax=Paenibacillus eucommiae TaxID=1355755 RepID=A0ABS4IMC3_9BACL|nr:winged helix DNA-binding protein [Paenibacillus eucommiae]MBP1988718.1 DNA-binding MarR family transcriptional regulator [Paenibacillus eucommiae]